MSASPENNNELNDLLAAFIDGETSAEHRRRLGELVAADPAARALYLDHCRMHAALSWEHGVLGGLNFPVAEDADIVVGTNWRRRSRPLAFAASLVLLIGLVWQVGLPVMRKQAWVSQPVIGTVKRSSGGQLSVSGIGVRLAVGDSIRKGEYELTGGLSQLVFENKVEILIEAPARFRIDSAQRLALFEGRLSAVVPPEGFGITVVTPNAEVVDLGTEFGVEVLAAEYSEIHVFKGEVEVKPHERSIEAIRLLTDQATRLDDNSGSPSGIAIAPDRFLRKLNEPRLLYSKRIHDLKPAAYYRMRPSDDGLTLIDVAGGDYHGHIELGSMKRSPFAPGRHGNALRLPGPASEVHAIVPDYPKATNHVLSVVAWVRADSRSRWASIAKNWAPDKEGQFHFGLLHDQGGLEVQISQPDGRSVQAMDPESFPLGEWQHVAFVADGAQLRLYRNGMQVGSAPYSGLAPPDLKPLGIGAKPAGVDQKRVRGPSEFWHGRIDELAIFNHAIDAKTIRQLFETEFRDGALADEAQLREVGLVNGRGRPGQRADRRRR